MRCCKRKTREGTVTREVPHAEVRGTGLRLHVPSFLSWLNILKVAAGCIGAERLEQWEGF